MVTSELNLPFNKAVKSLIEIIQPEYERIKKLKSSPALSTERAQQIIYARRLGISIDFGEQERVYHEIDAYNNKIKGIAMALTAISVSYDISPLVVKRFEERYTLC